MKTLRAFARGFAVRQYLVPLLIGVLLGGVLAGFVAAQTRSVEYVGSYPFIRLVGREASGRTWEITEAAGVLTLFNSTSNVANLRLGGNPPGSVLLPAVLFAALGTPANGSQAYCSDCGIGGVCAGAGTGAWAKRLNGGWVCN